MKIDVNDNTKIVSIWCGCEENVEEHLPNNIEEKLNQYRQKKYRICMYQSGQDDIKNNVLNLILNNAH